MTEIPSVVNPESVWYQLEASSSEGAPPRPTMLRQEQKSVYVMAELIHMFTKPGDVVVDLFAGTFAVSKACVMSGQPLMFVGYDADDLCVKKARSEVMRWFIQSVLREQNPIPATTEERTWARIVLKAISSNGPGQKRRSVEA